MSGDEGLGAEDRHDVDLFVEEAPFAQDLECPACGEQFKEFVTENIAASTCPQCNTWIKYVRSRSAESAEDETEQTELVTDGGRDVSETEIRRADGGLVDTTAAGWSVQRAAPKDREDIERIWSNQFDDPRAECHQQTLDECLDPEHELHPYSQAYVAADGRGRVVGFGLVALRNTGDMYEHTTLPESEFSGRDGYLYLSAVAEDWKRKGIGSQLFAERLRWCVEENANAVYGVAWQNPQGPTSDPLFQKFGFEKIADAPDDYYRGRDCPVCTDECDCNGVIYRRKL